MNERAERLGAALSGRYRVDAELGAGGMATVYSAHDIRHDRPVAIKVLNEDIAAAIGADRFLAEIRTTAKLQHPHIMPLFDSGDADGMLFFVMPLVVGPTLRDRMRQEHQLSIDETLTITAAITSALDYAHRHGVVHRDIKPENILLHDGQAMLADFGIALATKAQEPRLTQTGMAMGTPAYMSPEQALGERTIDARTDIYSVGTVVYEMLTGVTPFVGPTAQAVVAKLLTEDAVPPSRHRHDLPAGIDAAVLGALRKDPAERFTTAAALREAFQSPTPASRLPRRRPRRWVAVATLVVVVAVALVFAVRHRASSAPPPLIAVLPFTNVTGDSANTALGEGLPLAIFDALRPLRLNVVPIETSTEAARHYVHTGADYVAGVGRELSAAVVLGGEFQQDAGRVRIHVYLRDLTQHTVLWSEQFDGEADLFKLEDSVALAVANALRVTLTAGQLAAFRAPSTVDPAVYRLVLRARGYIERRDFTSLHTGIDLLHGALAVDSTYAPAWAALAQAHLLSAVYGVSRPDSDFRAATTAVQHALQLDSTLADAHLTLAILRVFHTNDLPGSDAEFARTLALDSTNASAWLFRTWYYFGDNQPDSALIAIRRARALDPNSAIIRAREGTTLYFLGRFRESASVLEAALKADSGNIFARDQLAQTDADERQCGPALQLANAPTFAGSSFENSMIPYTQARCGDTVEAKRTVTDLEARYRQGEFVDPFATATIYAALGDTTRTYAWLDRAVSAHVWELWALRTHPGFAPLLHDAHFQALLTQADQPK